MVIHNISALNVRFGMTEEGLDLLGVNIIRAEKHLENNKEQYKNDIIVLQDNDYTDLTKLLEIIVRNF